MVFCRFGRGTNNRDGRTWNPEQQAETIGVIRKTGFRTGIESIDAPNAARGSIPVRCSATMAKLPGSDCRHTRQKVTRSEPIRIGNGSSEQAGSDLGTMKEFTVRSFAEAKSRGSLKESLRPEKKGHPI